MSLDFYLEAEEPIARTGSGIFIREDGAMVEISRAEWDARWPDREPIVLDRETETTRIFWRNITHNLSRMAVATGLYEPLWRPDESGLLIAKQLIIPLRTGLETLRSAPDKWRKFDAPNGWGKYENLVSFVAAVLQACLDYPEASVRISS